MTLTPEEIIQAITETFEQNVKPYFDELRKRTYVFGRHRIIDCKRLTPEDFVAPVPGATEEG